jgi:hypothetical protein
MLPVVVGERREEHRRAVQREEAVDAGVREVVGLLEVVVKACEHHLDA